MSSQTKPLSTPHMSWSAQRQSCRMEFMTTSWQCNRAHDTPTHLLVLMARVSHPARSWPLHGMALSISLSFPCQLARSRWSNVFMAVHPPPFARAAAKRQWSGPESQSRGGDGEKKAQRGVHQWVGGGLPTALLPWLLPMLHRPTDKHSLQSR